VAAPTDWAAVDSIRADVFIPKSANNNAINFWLRIENQDGSIDDSYRDQPQATIWGHWNRLLFPVDPRRLARARRIAIVVNSPVPIGSSVYFGQIETQKTLRQPNGRYWAAYMYRHYFGTALLAAGIGEVSRDHLAAYASRAADGSVFLMVVNKDPTSDVAIPVSLSGYSAASSAEAITWSGDNYVWDPAQAVAVTDTPPRLTTVAAGSQFTYTFPRYSITALHIFPK
jgi:hypothetical protein